MGRDGDLGGDVAGAARDQHISIKAGDDGIASPGPLGAHHQVGARRGQVEAGDLVIEAEPGALHREAFQRRGLRATRIDDVADAPDDVVIAGILLATQANAPILHVHQGELYPHQGDALHDELALQEGRGLQPNGRLGRGEHHLAVGIGDARAQHHQIHPALVAAPFNGGLVIIQVDARKRRLDGARQGAPQRPQRHRSPQQAQARPHHEKHDGGDQNPRRQRRTADVVGLYVMGKRQLHAGFLRGSGALLRLLGLKRANVPASCYDAAIAPDRPDGVKSDLLEGLGNFDGVGSGRQGPLFQDRMR